MANKYKKKGSPYWWIRFKGASGKYKDVSSKLRHSGPGSAQETKECDARLVLTEAEEGRKANNAELWESWVENFFTVCVQDEGTLNGYRQTVPTGWDGSACTRATVKSSRGRSVRPGWRSGEARGDYGQEFPCSKVENACFHSATLLGEIRESTGQTREVA